MNCSNCDRTFSPKGIKNHEATCNGKNKPALQNSNFGEIFQAIIRGLAYIKVSWFIPEWNILSLVFYCAIVYPMLYMLVVRLLLAPVWDVLTIIFKIGEWFASFYDAVGITPNSIPRPEQSEKSPGRVALSWLTTFGTFIKKGADKYA